MDIIEGLKVDFKNVFGDDNPLRTFFAPGRVNLIGEHTDYNGGHVFPCALNIGTYAVGKLRNDNHVRLYSMNFKNLGIITFDLEELSLKKEHDWANYPKGVIKVFKEKGFQISRGFDIIFYGNIPNGAGLSSSASIEMLTCVFLKSMFNLDVDMITMTNLARLAENSFIGVNCGIMDQFSIGMGKEGSAVLLDCNCMKYRYSALSLDDMSIVVSNTNKKRSLADSKYNERCLECASALNKVRKCLDINYLCEMTIEQFEKNSNLLDSIELKRTRHAVYENQRTIRGAQVLEQNNIYAFGKLMNESHNSLRDDYEVTGVELDLLVELALNQDGVIGSRMTGAGFGGCTVSIVKNTGVDEFIRKVGEEYSKRIGYNASFYVVSTGDGAREIIGG